MHDFIIRAKMNSTTFKQNVSFIFSMVILVLAVISIVANTCILILFINIRRLRSTTNCLVANLAVSDLCFSIFAIPCQLVARFLPESDLTCLLNSIPTTYFTTSSIFSLCLIGIIKYINITKPLKNCLIITRNRAYKAIIFVWLFAGILSFIPVVFIANKKLFCHTFSHDTGQLLDKYYFLAVFIITYAMPTIILVYVYSVIYKIARRQCNRIRRSFKSVRRDTDEVNSALPSSKSATFLFALVICFVLCYTPYFISGLIYRFTLLKSSYIPQNITVCFIAANSAINPFLYGMLKPEFRYNLKFYFRLSLCKDDSTLSSSSSCSQRLPFQRTASQLSTTNPRFV